MRSLDDDLFELVFERIDEPRAVALWRTLLGHDAQFPSEENEGARDVSVESLVLQHGAVLGNVHVRLLRYDQNVYDVELNFRFGQSEETSKRVLIAALFEFAAKLADANGITTYFAGLEPASDKDTRLFTGREEGPYYRLI